MAGTITFSEVPVITREDGVLKLHKKVASLLAYIKPKENTRYAIDRIGIEDNTLAVTDGRRLFTMELPEGLAENGSYFLTPEGWLVDHECPRAFPKWRELIPQETSLIHKGNLTPHGEGTYRIIKKICAAGYLLNLNWLLSILKRLQACGVYEIEARNACKDSDYLRPIMLKGTIGRGKFIYLQIPLKS